MRIFAPFTKVEPQDDGSIRIHGIASTESRDSDGEIVLASAIKAAIPDFVKFGGTGTLREQHNASIAAGVVDAIAVDDDHMTRVSAIVVDEGSVRKIKHGVLKGVSLGGKATARDPHDYRTITAVDLVEVSIVDRPSNPDCLLTLAKTDMVRTIYSALESAVNKTLRKATMSSNAYEFEEAFDPERMNTGNPARLDQINSVNINRITRSTDPDLRNAPQELQPDHALPALHDGRPGPDPDPRDAFRRTFAQPHFWQLDGPARPDSAAARDLQCTSDSGNQCAAGRNACAEPGQPDA